MTYAYLQAAKCLPDKLKEWSGLRRKLCKMNVHHQDSMHIKSDCVVQVNFANPILGSATLCGVAHQVLYQFRICLDRLVKVCQN